MAPFRKIVSFQVPNGYAKFQLPTQKFFFIDFSAKVKKWKIGKKIEMFFKSQELFSSLPRMF